MSDDRSSLEWDNDSMLVNLSSKLDRSIFSVLQMVQEAEEVSPVLEVPTSPISPFRRVTRRLVEEGTIFCLTRQASLWVQHLSEIQLLEQICQEFNSSMTTFRKSQIHRQLRMRRHRCRQISSPTNLQYTHSIHRIKF